MNILLIRPPFNQARNNKYNSVPLGLLKISAWKKSLGNNVYYVNGSIPTEDIPYDTISEIYVTSVFTYELDIVLSSARFWKSLCKNAKLILGGTAVTMMPEYCKQQIPEAEIVVGYHPEAEKFIPDYSVLQTDSKEINNTQIIHTQRSCKYKCPWCMVYKIEPEDIFYNAEFVKNRILANPNRKDVLLYDNNFLGNIYLNELLDMFIELHKEKKFKFMATQGFKNILMTQELAHKIKSAGFYNIRFSWDNESQEKSALNCIEFFENAGYKRNSLQLFVIINNTETPKVIEKRYLRIYELGCSIHSDRYRPPDSTYDNYHKGGTDYFINSEYGWSDSNIRSTLNLMSQINYSTRMGCMLCEVDRMQKASILNKGKSSQNLNIYL